MADLMTTFSEWLSTSLLAQPWRRPAANRNVLASLGLPCHLCGQMYGRAVVFARQGAQSCPQDLSERSWEIRGASALQGYLADERI